VHYSFLMVAHVMMNKNGETKLRKKFRMSKNSSGKKI
jgi:hypothetical protein